MTYVYPVFSSGGASRYAPRYRDHRQQIKVDLNALAEALRGYQPCQDIIEKLTPSRGDLKMKRFK